MGGVLCAEPRFFVSVTRAAADWRRYIAEKTHKSYISVQKIRVEPGGSTLFGAAAK